MRPTVAARSSVKEIERIMNGGLTRP